MKALILTADGVEDLELLYPFYRLKEEDIDVDVAGPTVGSITGKNGYSLEARLGFRDVDFRQYDLLLLPGGKAPETVRVSDGALDIVRQMMKARKTIAAICHGAQVLISAGVIRGRHATCWPGVRDDLKAAGARFTDREVVVDGNLITSRMPDDLPAFCRAILKAVGSKARHSGSRAPAVVANPFVAVDEARIFSND